jgi:hypothetical protein
MSNDILENLIKDALPFLRQFCVGEYGISLGGSCAKGISDKQSDLDFYIFARQVLPCAQRTTQIEQMPHLFTQVRSWGNDTNFIEGGIDFWYQDNKVECWLRNIQYIEEILDRCKRGEIERTCVAWTVMGFYNYVALSDIRVMQILEDPFGIMASWKAKVSEYPSALREAIVGRYFAEAKFWPDNFHYRSAIERGDILYTSGIVQQVVYALIQVVFALNRAYFPGEKKLGVVLEHLALQPRDFYRRIRELVYPGNDGSNGYLQTQREALGGLVNDVERLINADNQHT